MLQIIRCIFFTTSCPLHFYFPIWSAKYNPNKASGCFESKWLRKQHNIFKVSVWIRFKIAYCFFTVYVVNFSKHGGGYFGWGSYLKSLGWLMFRSDTSFHCFKLTSVARLKKTLMDMNFVKLFFVDHLFFTHYIILYYTGDLNIMVVM